MRQVPAALCIWGAMGCASQPVALPAARRPEPPRPSAIETIAPSVAAPARVRTIAEVLPGVAAPAERVCSVSSAKWSGGLQVGPGKPVYGYVTDGPMRLSLGADTRDGSAFAEAADRSLELVGTIDQPEIFTKNVTTLAGFVTPLAKTPLGWQPAGAVGQVAVTLDISDSFAVPSVVDKTMSCDKLTINEPSYNAGAIVANGRKATAAIGGGVDLLPAPGRAPIARTKDNNYEEVVVFETRGKHTRVAIQGARYYAVGWVASESISELGIGGLGAMGGLGLMSGTMHTRGCAHDLELIVEVEGKRHVVGRLRSGADFQASTLDVADGFTSLKLGANWFSPATGVKLLVRTQDLAGC